MTCKDKNILDCCLFFTANSLARVITRMGEEEFARVGLTPSSAFLLTLVMHHPNMLQKDLADLMHLAPSTVSRLVDSMVKCGVVAKHGSGRTTQISATDKGRELGPTMQQAWQALHARYCEILGEDEAHEVTRITREAFRKLDDA